VKTPVRLPKALIRAALGVYWAGLFVMTSLPGDSLPSVGAADKLVHFGAYFILGGIFLLAARTRSGSGIPVRSSVVPVLAVILLYAAFDEWHQDWIPGRDGSIGDWASDLAGAAAGILAAFWLAGGKLRKSRP
jgi:VanZ family protein